MVGSQVQDSTRLLFGGAMTASIPEEFADVSKIREIPDNQEVFAHADTDRSLIIELLEMENPLPEPHQLPAAFHFSVLARDAGAIEAVVHEVSELPAADYPRLTAGDPNVSITVANGMHLVSKFRDDESRANRVGVYLICVRLPRGTTDLLMVFNDPVMLHPESASTRMGSSVANPGDTSLSRRASVLRAALATLQIKDWSLMQ